MADRMQNPAAQGIYGHEVLNLLMEFGGATTLDILRASASDAFGPDAVFCNCHGSSFNFDQLMEFFTERGKVESDGRTVCLTFSQPCGGH